MFHAKAIVHLSKRHVISPPRGFGNSGIGLFPFGNSESDFVWDSGKDEISLGNSEIEIFVHDS